MCEGTFYQHLSPGGHFPLTTLLVPQTQTEGGDHAGSGWVNQHLPSSQTSPHKLAETWTGLNQVQGHSLWPALDQADHEEHGYMFEDRSEGYLHGLWSNSAPWRHHACAAPA